MDRKLCERPSGSNSWQMDTDATSPEFEYSRAPAVRALVNKS